MAHAAQLSLWRNELTEDTPILPHSEASELELLAQIHRGGNEHMKEVLALGLRAEHFYHMPVGYAPRGLLFKALESIFYRRGDVRSYAELEDQLRHDDCFTTVGPELRRLDDSWGVARKEFLVGKIKETFLLREVMRRANDLVTLIGDGQIDDPMIASMRVRELAEFAQSYDQRAVSSLVSLNSRRPVLSDAALYGLAGDWIRTIEPHTEASNAALLAQFLVSYGNVIGRTAHFRAEADNHYMNLFVVVVGLSSKARKGTSWGHVVFLFDAIDPDWRASGRGGLESGEGIIFHVRDGSGSDLGVTDKRLLVVESEFGAPLRIMERTGNTLSPTLRQAWDRGDLEGLTKNSPTRATGAHISTIGHITEYELQQHLNAVEASNGFSNRFLWVCSERSKSLPRGGGLNTVDLQPIVNRLRDAVKFGKRAGELRPNDEAWALWDEVYDELSEGKQGLLGAVTSRGEAQVMRLACCYALLDLSDAITKTHLEAALALWQYCEQSAAFIFGDRLGDPVADRILESLKGCSEGLTRTDISHLFKRHKSTVEIDGALRSLTKQGRIRSTPEQTTGRPAERFFAVVQGAKKAKEAKEADGQSDPDGLSSLSSLNSQSVDGPPVGVAVDERVF
jgi:uncharacterized protein DUF3987